jgi:endonuclease/exonuclease/phosphatase family metal-dependent hydrolase
MKIKIMTWNTALTEGSNVDDVLNYIKDFLKEDNTIAVLQQIPYKDPKKRWAESASYQSFVKAFLKTEYKVFNKKFPKTEDKVFNKKLGNAIMYTVIVTKMENVAEADGIETSNREVAVCVDGSIVIYGLHARSREDNKSYLQSLNSVQADILLGDFNAGDYAECENKLTFRDILKNHVCICNKPTKEVRNGNSVIRRTCIDHIFVKRELITRCSEPCVREDIKYSDHYPIIFSIEIDKQ